MRARLNPFAVDQSDLSAICRYIADMLENTPGDGIAYLSQNTLHFVANKDEFDNMDILPNEERDFIAESFAKYFGA